MFNKFSTKGKLSGLEQQIYFSVEKSANGIVRFETLKNLNLCSENTLKVILNRMVKKGWFKRLKRGTYLIQSFGFESNGDPIAVAQAVFNGYLGFGSALYFHGIADEYPFTVFIVTNSTSKTVPFGSFELKAVALKDKAVGFETKNGIVVSTIAKTLFDCFYLPEYAGGYSKILKAFYNARMDEKQLKEFKFYVERFADKGLRAKIGFLLSKLKHTGVKFNKTFFQGFKPAESKLKISGNSGQCKFDKNWNVLNCSDDLLSWWGV